MNKLLHKLPDACEALGIGRSTLYELIADGTLATVKIGRRTLIAHDELERYVSTLKGASTDRVSGCGGRVA